MDLNFALTRQYRKVNLLQPACQLAAY